ncbi:MAG TPA: prephenate dehydrogenase/arogenate dehydrogenase family protein [Thermoanaerobaculia bacterium]|nr:prephenate dehydrogenase/arogenate dehydrogenase family protein [Thermoanaerobaculia bacterium]
MQALIVGLGLVGGSLGMALRRRGWQVAFVDPAVTLEQALVRMAADERREAIEWSKDEIIVLATPVDVAVRFLEEAAASSGAIVTSVCSVMAPLVRAAGGSVSFVAGHPLAGSHQRGLGSARSDLFEGRVWFVDRAASDPRISRLVADAGARLTLADPEEHDRAIALTSHLPQVLSTALGALIAKDEDALRDYFGSGLQTFLRLAQSSREVWEPVIEANRENLDGAIRQLIEIVERILRGDGRSDFEAAQRLWRE